MEIEKQLDKYVALYMAAQIAKGHSRGESEEMKMTVEIANKLYEECSPHIVLKGGINTIDEEYFGEDRVYLYNTTGNPEDDRVCVNPELTDLVGSAEAGEGCLSLREQSQYALYRH